MTKFEIHTSDVESIIGDFVVNDPSELNTIQRGETATYDFVETTTKFTVASGTSDTIEAGETETYGLVVIESNGTLTVDGTLNCEQIQNNGTLDNNGTINISEEYVFEYVEVEDYAEHSGAFTTFQTLENQIPYREFLPSDVDTLLVGIEPLSDLATKDITGYWGLINNVTDLRNQALSNGPRIRVEITVLATYDEYADHTAVQNGLEL